MIARCQHPSVRPAAGPAQPRPADRAAALRAGVLLASRYRVTELLGSGATASVWRAHDVLLDRDVAVKRFHQRHSHGVAEARIAARVRHPNVAAVHDVITHDGSYGLVMDYYGRATLTALLRGGRRLPPRIVAALGLQLLAALQAVHAAGVVHCDVKPANLLLGDDGRLVLIDFGIAETGDEPAHPARRNGDVVGSPAYMAPEVVRGEAPGPPADLWSLGATLYTAVEGRPPFPPGDPVPTLAAVLHDPPAPTRRAARLQPLLTRLLAKDPAARPAHDAIHALLTDAYPAALAAVLAPRGGAAGPPPADHSVDTLPYSTIPAAAEPTRCDPPLGAQAKLDW